MACVTITSSGVCFVSKQRASTSFRRQVLSTLLVQWWRGSSGNVRLSNLLISSCHYNVTKIVECTISSDHNVSKTLISLAIIREILACVRETGYRAEIRELPENTGDLATLYVLTSAWARLTSVCLLGTSLYSDYSIHLLLY